MATIPDVYHDLLTRPVVVALSVTLPTGLLQVTPDRRDYDGEHIRVNTADSTARYRAWQTHPEATVLAIDPGNPYRYLELRGRVGRFETEGANEHIDTLAQKYMGIERFPWHDSSVTRVICYIAPERVVTSG